MAAQPELGLWPQRNSQRIAGYFASGLALRMAPLGPLITRNTKTNDGGIFEPAVVHFLFVASFLVGRSFDVRAAAGFCVWRSVTGFGFNISS